MNETARGCRKERGLTRAERRMDEGVIPGRKEGRERRIKEWDECVGGGRENGEGSGEERKTLLHKGMEGGVGN